MSADFMRLFNALLVFTGAVCLLAPLVVDRGEPDNSLAERERFGKVLAAMRARHEAAVEWLEGRQSFAAAAFRFRQCAADDPTDVMRWLRMLHPGRSDDELYDIHVLMYAEAELRRLKQPMPCSFHRERDDNEAKSPGDK